MTAAPKFTPGPWVTSRCDDDSHEVHSKDLNGAGDYVANVYSERDVYLIAAAPELYAALREMIASIDRADYTRTPSKAAMAAARAALAKVTP